MAQMRVVSLPGLRRRLASELRERPALRHLLDDALANMDDHLVDAALEALRHEPAELQERVRVVMLDWLFGQDSDDLADLEPACAWRH